MNTMKTYFPQYSKKPLGYPNARISAATLFSWERSELENKKYSCGAKNSSLVDISRYASSRFAFFARNTGVSISHYY